jgi:hypothetical protein
MTDPIWTPDVPCAVNLTHTCSGPTTPCPSFDDAATCRGAVHALAEMALAGLTIAPTSTDVPPEEWLAGWHDELVWCAAVLKAFPRPPRT